MSYVKGDMFESVEEYRIRWAALMRRRKRNKRKKRNKSKKEN